jgi:hypothetical protein
MAWSGLMELASIGPHGIPYELREALRAEKREGLPQNLAKLRLVESAISGAERPTRNLGDLHGIRQAHVTAMMVGARLSNNAQGLEAVMALGASLGEAGTVLQAEWAAR